MVVNRKERKYLGKYNLIGLIHFYKIDHEYLLPNLHNDSHYKTVVDYYQEDLPSNGVIEFNDFVKYMKGIKIKYNDRHYWISNINTIKLDKRIYLNILELILNKHAIPLNCVYAALGDVSEYIETLKNSIVHSHLGMHTVQKIEGIKGEGVNECLFLGNGHISNLPYQWAFKHRITDLKNEIKKVYNYKIQYDNAVSESEKNSVIESLKIYLIDSINNKSATSAQRVLFIIGMMFPQIEMGFIVEYAENFIRVNYPKTCDMILSLPDTPKEMLIMRNKYFPRNGNISLDDHLHGHHGSFNNISELAADINHITIGCEFDIWLLSLLYKRMCVQSMAGDYSLFKTHLINNTPGNLLLIKKVISSNDLIYSNLYYNQNHVSIQRFKGSYSISKTDLIHSLHYVNDEGVVHDSFLNQKESINHFIKSMVKFKNNRQIMRKINGNIDFLIWRYKKFSLRLSDGKKEGCLSLLFGIINKIASKYDDFLINKFCAFICNKLIRFMKKGTRNNAIWCNQFLNNKCELYFKDVQSELSCYYFNKMGNSDEFSVNRVIMQDEIISINKETDSHYYSFEDESILKNIEVPRFMNYDTAKKPAVNWEKYKKVKSIKPFHNLEKNKKRMYAGLHEGWGGASYNDVIKTYVKSTKVNEALNDFEIKKNDFVIDKYLYNFDDFVLNHEIIRDHIPKKLDTIREKVISIKCKKIIYKIMHNYREKGDILKLVNENKSLIREKIFLENNKNFVSILLRGEAGESLNENENKVFKKYKKFFSRIKRSVEKHKELSNECEKERNKRIEKIKTKVKDIKKEKELIRTDRQLNKITSKLNLSRKAINEQVKKDKKSVFFSRNYSEKNIKADSLNEMIKKGKDRIESNNERIDFITYSKLEVSEDARTMIEWNKFKSFNKYNVSSYYKFYCLMRF